MKRILALMCMGVLLSFGTAHALSTDGFWMGDVYTGATNDGTLNNVVGLDWSSSGSGTGVQLGENGTLNLVQATSPTGFTFLYQSYLAGFTTNGGGPITTATTLNTNYEFTVTSTIQERLVSLTNSTGSLGAPGFDPTVQPTTALFQTLAGSTFQIYLDTTPDADVLNGTGFNDGILAASGTFQVGDYSAFTLLDNDPATGIGTATLFGAVTSFDSAIFGFDTATGLPIMSFRVENNLNQPPLDSATLTMFNGHNVVYNNTNYDPTTNTADVWGDARFKVDASSKFGVGQVPEPSTMLLLGIGLLGLAGYGKKRMKN